MCLRVCKYVCTCLQLRQVKLSKAAAGLRHVCTRLHKLQAGEGKLWLGPQVAVQAVGQLPVKLSLLTWLHACSDCSGRFAKITAAASDGAFRACADLGCLFRSAIAVLVPQASVRLPKSTPLQSHSKPRAVLRTAEWM